MMKSLQRCLFLVVSTCVYLVHGGSPDDSSSPKSYDGYTVIRTVPSTEDQVHFLHKLETKVDQDFHYMERVDFWKRASAVNSPVDIMMSPDLKDEFITLLNKEKLLHREMVNDVNDLFLNERISNESLMYAPLPKSTVTSLRQGDSSFFTEFHRLSEIHEYMQTTAAAFPDIMKVKSIGKSHEGRDLLAYYMGYNETVSKRDVESPKQVIWIDAGIHAREWISPATALFIVTQFGQKAATDPFVRQMLTSFDLVILPVSNPDGYEHTHVSDRMWRKTRRANYGAFGFCRGTDPNRNWGFHWNEAGASNSPCSDIYAGPAPFSEPETKAMSDFLLSIKSRLAMYLSLHSYSQLFLTPWGYTRDLPENYPELERVALSASKALNSLYGTTYTVGSSTRVLYAAAGGSDDWAMGVAGAKYSYTMELRDTGDHGFVLPKEQIIPSGEETFVAVLDLAQSIALEKGLVTTSSKTHLDIFSNKSNPPPGPNNINRNGGSNNRNGGSNNRNNGQGHGTGQGTRHNTGYVGIRKPSNIDTLITSG